MVGAGCPKEARETPGEIPCIPWTATCIAAAAACWKLAMACIVAPGCMAGTGGYTGAAAVVTVPVGGAC